MHRQGTTKKEPSGSFFWALRTPLNSAPTRDGAPLRYAHDLVALYAPFAHAGSGLLHSRRLLDGHAVPHDDHAAQYRHATQVPPAERRAYLDVGLSKERTGQQAAAAAAPQPSVAQLALHRAAHANALAHRRGRAVYGANTLDANNHDLLVDGPNDPYTIGNAHPSNSSNQASKPFLQQAPR